MSRLLSSRREVLLSGALLGAHALLPLPALAQAAKRGGTLVVGSEQVPRHLNGAVQSGYATALPSTQLFASPLRFDDQWKPQPYLAEKWSLSEDGRTFTLNLRRDAVFHDGKPVTSADVAFSIMAIKANHPFQTMFAPVEKVDTPDVHTAIVRMATPHPAIVLAMSPALCPILPKHIYGDGQDLKSHPRNSKDVVGSGPFKLVEFSPTQRIVLERNDKFFLAGKPYLDRLVININTDFASLLLGLERGENQLIGFVSNPVDLRRLQANKNLEMTPRGYEGIGPIEWLAFNMAKKPLDDKRVRHAIAYALDKKFLLKVLKGGFAQRDLGPIVPTSPFADPGLEPYDMDLKKSAALLDAAGLKPGANGERLKLTLDNYTAATLPSAEYIRAQLRKVGITIELRPSDFPTWAKRVSAHDFDLTMDSVWNWGDPVIGVHRTYLSTNIRPVVWTNTQSYENPKVDELLAQAGGLIDTTQRKAYYATFQKLVVDDMPVHYLNVFPYHTVTSKKVGNVPATIWGMLSPMDEVFLR